MQMMLSNACHPLRFWNLCVEYLFLMFRQNVTYEKQALGGGGQKLGEGLGQWP